MPTKNAFENDDYGELNTRYFKILRESKSMIADPSGWVDTYSKVGTVYPQFIGEIQGYHTDISNQLNEKKKFIIDLASEWDAYSYSQDNITLCHSATTGSIIVMAFLLSKGIKAILSETPNYFATYYQAESIGLKMIRIPSYYTNDFSLEMDTKTILENSPCAIWLTQPRTALGMNQNADWVKNILNKMSSNDFLIIDEATEQSFPSILSPLTPETFPQVIKIRSLFKGLGINGIRLAYIAHNQIFRSSMSDEMEIFLGALDIFSINHGVDMAKDIPRFKLLLSVANDQVATLRRKAERVLKGTNCELSKIVNGYIGSAYIKFDGMKYDHETNRERFVEYCAKERVPVILGAAMGFPKHEQMEFIRLNYFNRDNNILDGLRVLSRFSG